MTMRYFPLAALLTLCACSDTALAPHSPAAPSLSAVGAEGPTG